MAGKFAQIEVEDLLYIDIAKSSPDEFEVLQAEGVKNALVGRVRSGDRTLLYLSIVRGLESPQFPESHLIAAGLLCRQIEAVLERFIFQTQMESELEQMVRSLALTLETRDRFTQGHSERVSHLVVEVATHLGLSRCEVEVLYRAALLHDVGKIGIADVILNKPGRLTPDEYEEVKKHPEFGARIVGSIARLADASTLINAHHEHFMGGGYPEGTAGNDIPMGARILAVCDAYEALTSERAYRHAMTQAEALSIIRDETPSKYDPTIVEALERVVEDVKASAVGEEDDVWAA